MAVTPKSQLLKLGIGTMSVVAIVGATGWVWETTSSAVPPQQPTAPDAGSTGYWPQWEEEDHDDDDDDDDHERSFRLARPGTPSGRVRTRRS